VPGSSCVCWVLHLCCFWLKQVSTHRPTPRQMLVCCGGMQPGKSTAQPRQLFACSAQRACLIGVRPCRLHTCSFHDLQINWCCGSTSRATPCVGSQIVVHTHLTALRPPGCCTLRCEDVPDLCASTTAACLLAALSLLMFSWRCVWCRAATASGTKQAGRTACRCQGHEWLSHLPCFAVLRVLNNV
jgi:hypothetical protein